MLTKPIFIVAPFLLTLAAAQHDSGNDSRLMFSDEIVSCYKDRAGLVLFHDVEMRGHSGREHPLEIGQGVPGSRLLRSKRAATSAVKKACKTIRNSAP
jgi:hypothetical protein